MRKHLAYINQQLTPRIKSVIALGAAVVLLLGTTIFAAPPGSQYNPAETLDPSCAPGDVNCSVDISSSGGDITIGDDVISGTANRVLFLDGSGDLADSADFLWDDTNKVFEVGDVTGGANSTTLTVDDANQNITATSNLDPNYTHEFILGPTGYFGVGDGIAMSRENTSDQIAFSAVGDATGVGGGLLTASMGYIDLNTGEESSSNYDSDGQLHTFVSSLGGDSGLDDVQGFFSMQPTDIGAGWYNDTLGVLNQLRAGDTDVSLIYGNQSPDERDLRLDSRGLSLSDGNGDTWSAFNITDSIFEIGDIDSVGNDTLFTINDDAQDIYATANWFAVNDTSSNGWLQVDTNNRAITIGDTASVGNDTLFTIDDANNNVTLTNNVTAGYQFGLQSDPLIGGFFPGGSMSWANTGTGEAASLILGDFTGFGQTDVIGQLAYSNALQTNTAFFNVGNDRADSGFKTTTGGNSGTDTIDSSVLMGTDVVFINYINSTQGLDQNIALDDFGIDLYSLQTVQLGDVIGNGNGTVLSVSDGTQGITFDYGGDTYTFPIGDGSANQLLQTDGSGNLAWVDDINEPPVTNYRLARELNVPYKKEVTQVVSVPEFDDPVAPSTYEAGGSHGLIYIEQHDILYSTVRNDPPGFIRFNDPDDLTDYDYVEVTGVGAYTHPDQIVYSPYTDKVYMALSSFYTQNSLRVIEIDPTDNSYSLVIDDPYGSPSGGPTITVIDNYLYAVQGYSTPEVGRYDLDTFALDDSVEITPEANAAHALETDGEYLYITTTWPEHTTGLNSVTKIDAATMTIVDTQDYSLGSSSQVVGGFTDDIMVWGSYLYAPVEAYDVGSNRILKVNTEDLTDFVFLDVDIDATDFHSIFTDGEYIYYGGPNNTLGRFDPETNTGELYDATDFPGSNVNELATDGTRLFFAGFDAYPVSGDGFVGRLAFFEGLVETYVLNADGTKLSTLDKANSRLGINDGAPDYSLDVNYDGAGVVARFTSTDGNCTIDPAVVGGISCSSDESLKKDIEPIAESQLDKLSQISPVEYHWKNDADEEQKTIGFIAQDVQEVLPELVSLDPTTQKLTMSYAGLAVPLVGSVRELGLRLTALEALNDLNINGNTNTIIKLFNDFLSTAQRIVINGLVEIKQATIDRLFAKRIATDTFCIDDMCITKDEFKTLLDNNELTERAQDIYNGIEDKELDEILEESQEESTDDESSGTVDHEQDSESQNDTNLGDSSDDTIETEEQIEDTAGSDEEVTEEDVIENDASTSGSGGGASSEETSDSQEEIAETEVEHATENQEESTDEEVIDEGVVFEENTQEVVEESAGEQNQEENSSESEQTVEVVEESEGVVEPEPEPETEEAPEPEPQSEPETEV